MSEMKHIHVVAGVIYNKEQQVLLSTRPQGKSYEGYWEFAGGKIEFGETYLEALKRELHEEINIEMEQANYWLTKTQKYSSAHIHLNFFKVTQWSGELQPKEGQKFSWQTPDALTVHPVLMANSSILKSLCIPKQFTGDLNTELAGCIYQQKCILVPENNTTNNERNGVILNTQSLTKCLKNKQRPDDAPEWVVAKLPSLQIWQECFEAGIDAIIFSILDEEDIAYLQNQLKKGMPTPLIIHNPNKLALGDELKQYHYSIIVSV